MTILYYSRDNYFSDGFGIWFYFLSKSCLHAFKGLLTRLQIHPRFRLKSSSIPKYQAYCSQLRPVQQEVHKSPPPQIPQQGPPQRAVHPATAGDAGEEDAAADER